MMSTAAFPGKTQALVPRAGIPETKDCTFRSSLSKRDPISVPLSMQLDLGKQDS